MPEGLFNTNKQSSSKIIWLSREDTLFKFLEIGAVFFSETRTGGTRTTSPFCNLYSGLIRPLFTRTSPLRRMR